MKVAGTIALDLGVSSTRFRAGDKEMMVPNNMVFCKDMKPTSMEPFDESIIEALDVTIESSKQNGIVQYPLHVLMGSLADRHSTNNERPSIMSKKYEQPVNYVSAIVSAAISKIVTGLEADTIMYVALPPVEIKHYQDKFVEELKGQYTVIFNKYPAGSKTVVPLNILDVRCESESEMAGLSFYFGSDGKPRNVKGGPSLDGIYLSIDIGQSTTDLAVFKYGKFDEKSGQTYPVGGAMVLEKVIESVRAKFGFQLPILDAQRVIAEGRVKLGNRYEEIPDIIRKAKEDTAEKLFEHMQSYFVVTDTPLQTINAIMVSGGGSLPSRYEEDGKIITTSPALSDFIAERLQKVCPGVTKIWYGDDARFANVRGLALKILRDYVQYMRDMKAQAAQAQEQEAEQQNTGAQTAGAVGASEE